MTAKYSLLERLKFTVVTKPFLTGLITMIPIMLTGYVGYWLFVSIEKIVKTPFLWVFPTEWYRPGVGIALGLALIYIIGLLMQAWVVKKLFTWLENTVLKLPLVKHIYQLFKDFFQYFEPSEKRSFGRVVRVNIPGHEAALIAFKTREAKDIPQAIQLEQSEFVHVYFPMSYGIGGYSAFIPKLWTTELNWSVKEATSYILSAGMAYKKHTKDKAD